MKKMERLTQITFAHAVNKYAQQYNKADLKPGGYIHGGGITLARAPIHPIVFVLHRRGNRNSLWFRVSPVT